MTWKIMTLLALVTPLAMLVLGLICWRFPPGGPNWALGFRSRRARAGDASWRFAQCWAGRLWFLLGLIWLVAVLLISGKQKELPVEAFLPVYLNLVGLQLASLLLVILGMNLALLIRFDRFGRVRTGKAPKQKKPENASSDDVYDEALPEHTDDEATLYSDEYQEEAAQGYEEYADYGDGTPGEYDGFGEFTEDEPFYDPAEDGYTDSPEGF